MSTNFIDIFAKKEMKNSIYISTVSTLVIAFSIIIGLIYPIFEILDIIDKKITVSLNFDGGLIIDAILYAMSSRITCSIFVLTIIALYIKRRTKLRKYIIIVLGLTIVITLCDQISSSIIKPYICRLRPSHTIGICDLLHYVYGYKGGQYGFVSSHAANTFGVAAFLSAQMRNKKLTILLLLWATIVSCSRIYLGVHYFGDVICGGILGYTIGTIMAYIIYFTTLKYVVWRHIRLRPQLKRYV